jgi:hypothetical protein
MQVNYKNKRGGANKGMVIETRGEIVKLHELKEQTISEILFCDSRLMKSCGEYWPDLKNPRLPEPLMDIGTYKSKLQEYNDQIENTNEEGVKLQALHSARHNFIFSYNPVCMESWKENLAELVEEKNTLYEKLAQLKISIALSDAASHHHF